MRNPIRRFRRKPTLRERLFRRVDDALGAISWRATRWWLRGVGSELRRSAAQLYRR